MGDLVSGKAQEGVDILGSRLILLRQTEYLRGILFLTTNFLPNIDEAFMSRIHLLSQAQLQITSSDLGEYPRSPADDTDRVFLLVQSCKL